MALFLVRFSAVSGGASAPADESRALTEKDDVLAEAGSSDATDAGSPRLFSSKSLMMDPSGFCGCRYDSGSPSRRASFASGGWCSRFRPLRRNRSG